MKELIKELKDEHWRGREGAAEALGRMGELAVPALIEALKEERNKKVKFWFAFALAEIEGKEGEGIKELRRMKEKGELKVWQIREFDTLCREFNIEEKVEAIKEGLESAREIIESQPASKERDASLEKIITLEGTVKELVEAIEDEQKERQRLEGLIGRGEEERTRLKELLTKFDYETLEVIQRKETLQAEINSLNKRVEDTHKFMRIAIMILSIVFGLVSAISLIFISLLMSGVLPK